MEMIQAQLSQPRQEAWFSFSFNLEGPRGRQLECERRASTLLGGRQEEGAGLHDSTWRNFFRRAPCNESLLCGDPVLKASQTPS